MKAIQCHLGPWDDIIPFLLFNLLPGYITVGQSQADKKRDSLAHLAPSVSLGPFEVRSDAKMVEQTAGF